MRTPDLSKVYKRKSDVHQYEGTTPKPCSKAGCRNWFAALPRKRICPSCTPNWVKARDQQKHLVNESTHPGVPRGLVNEVKHQVTGTEKTVLGTQSCFELAWAAARLADDNYKLSVTDAHKPDCPCNFCESARPVDYWPRWKRGITARNVSAGLQDA